MALASVAMPGISTGIFGYPKGPGCRVIAEEAARHLGGPRGTVVEVRLVSIDEETASHFLAAVRRPW
jgi:O-acetyl-ADP-ribose deacetylase (regulator of RNase III)